MLKKMVKTQLHLYSPLIKSKHTWIISYTYPAHLVFFKIIVITKHSKPTWHSLVEFQVLINFKKKALSKSTQRFCK